MSFEELDRVLREFGITRDAARRLYAQGVRLVDAENVECRTCGGAGYCVDSLTFPPEQIGQPCPDCTPENVECPT